jgi:hypothetical protein
MKGRTITRLAWLPFAATLTLILLEGSISTANGPSQTTNQNGEGVFLLLAVIGFASVGALVSSRQPANAIGWLFSGFALFTTLGGDADAYAQRAIFVASGSLPGGLAAAWFARLTQGPIIFSVFIFLFLLFPSGRPLSSRWRALAWLAAFVTLVGTFLYAFSPGPLTNTPYSDLSNPFGIPALEDLGDQLDTLVLLLTLGILAASVLSLILRFRRSNGDEREQIKWLASAGVFIAIAFAAAPVIWSTPALGNTLLWPALFVAAVVSLPISVGIAILKYHLYDIDVIIRRTLTYSILTALVLAVYFGSVITLEQLLVAITGQRQSEIVTVTATLAIAALFVPLRRRVQAMIDRRFYRRKYDAQQVLARFAATARDEVELGELTDQLLTVVDETMRPANMSLWVRKTEESVK